MRNLPASGETVINYYAVVNVENRRLGTYVSAENIAAAFEAARLKYTTRYPRLYIETVAVQEINDGYAARSPA